MSTALFHQAHLLPWPGYFARCLASDIVVFLSDVKFNKGYYHNRTKFKNVNGQLEWLTLPIIHESAKGYLKDTEILNPPLFKKWFRNFRLAYEAYNNFQEIWNLVEEEFQIHYPSLNLINQAIIIKIIKKFCDLNNVPIPRFYDSSDFGIKFKDKTERLELISKNLNINQILMGHDSLEVHDIHKLEINGIMCVRHIHCSKGDISFNKIPLPISGLSILHYILIDGWDKTANNLINNWLIATKK